MFSIYYDKVFTVFFVVLATIFGLVFGSFLNCFAWRLAHGESVAKGRSHCTSCGHTLGVWDLFPLFSWLFLGGKCRYCRAKISIRYPLTELSFAVITVLTLLKYDLTPLFLRNWILCGCLFLISLVDLEVFEIPFGAVITALVTWFVFVPFIGTDGTGFVFKDLLLHLSSAFVFPGVLMLIAAVMSKILKKESLGGGDVKLMAVLGLYAGYLSGLLAVLLSCVLGLILAAVYKKARPDGEGYFPFGPAICAALWLVLLYGEPVVNWYLSLYSI